MKTAEEFLEKENLPESISGGTLNYAMIEFAKMHCEAQLKAILENACMKEYNQGDWDTCWISNDMGDVYVLDKNSITNAYDLNQIK
jgi:hypothetical protein